jgi:hypothetical protein
MAIRLQFTNPEDFTARVTALETAVRGDESAGQFALYTAAGAITPGGTAFLLGGAANAMTLALPVAGPLSSGGQDGVKMTIDAGDAFAYTVTTPASGLNGSLHIATFAAAVGNNIELVAYNGSWYVYGTPRGVTLS